MPSIYELSSRRPNPYVRPPVDLVKACLSYDPISGHVTWTARPAGNRGSVPVGKRAGTVMLDPRREHHNYRRIAINGRPIPESHVIWALVFGFWPSHSIIDHINGDGCDNRFANLREVTIGENACNRRKHNKAGTSKLKGVSRKCNAWRATIRLHGKSLHLGYFRTEEEAHLAYCAAAVHYHGAFANFGHDTPPENCTAKVPRS